MSLAQLPYTYQIDTQNIFVTPDSSGNSNRLIFGNLDVSGLPGVPTDSYIHQVISPNDPNNPSAYLISYQGGGPNPLVDVTGFLGTGGSNVGSGAITAVYGDLEVGGALSAGSNNIIIDGSGLNLGFTAPALATDVSGYVIPVQSVNGQNKGALAGASPSFESQVQDTSIFVVDAINNTTTIYINCVVEGAVNATSTPNLAVLTVSMSGGTSAVPPLNSDFIDGNPNQNIIIFYGNINNITSPASSTFGLFYAAQTSSSEITISFNPALSVGINEKILIQGTFSYPN